MRLTLLLFLVSTFSISCSIKTGGQSGSSEAAQGCPLSLSIPSYSIKIVDPGVREFKKMIVLNGELKYDECEEQPVLSQQQPIVTASQTKDSVDILVQHFDGEAALPSQTSIMVINFAECRQHGVEYFSAENVKLKYDVTYPAGPSCGSNVRGSVVLTK